MTPTSNRARALTRFAKAISLCIAAMSFGAPPAAAGEVPTFAVDASWPKQLPNNWILGQIGGITADWQGHIWVVHRPRSLSDAEKGVTLNPPRSKCCVPAPPVLEFDVDGNLLRSWGGPGEGYEWVGREHGIEVDERGFVWVGGNADNDSEILKFTLDGKYLGQIGKIAPRTNSNDTSQFGRPAEVTIDKGANELYVADGYGNRRVIVFDATTLAYKRHWGGTGKAPNDDKQPPYDPATPEQEQFGNPVHCIKVANDGLVYACDRSQDRIQIFKTDGTYVKEWFYEKNTRGDGAVFDLALWPDPKQTYLLNADGANNEIRVIKRDDGSVVGTFGHSGRNAGQFSLLHVITVDKSGNVYTGEVEGKRIQKFKLINPDALR